MQPMNSPARRQSARLDLRPRRRRQQRRAKPSTLPLTSGGVGAGVAVGAEVVEVDLLAAGMAEDEERVDFFLLFFARGPSACRRRTASIRTRGTRPAWGVRTPHPPNQWPRTVSGTVGPERHRHDLADARAEVASPLDGILGERQYPWAKSTLACRQARSNQDGAQPRIRSRSRSDRAGTCNTSFAADFGAGSKSEHRAPMFGRA